MRYLLSVEPTHNLGFDRLTDWWCVRVLRWTNSEPEPTGLLRKLAGVDPDLTKTRPFFSESRVIKVLNTESYRDKLGGVRRTHGNLEVGVDKSPLDPFQSGARKLKSQ